MNVKYLMISDVDSRETIAILESDTEKWEDPHGGIFSPDEQGQFHRVALGYQWEVTMHRGTKHERHINVRLEARFT